jgi:hypothetical protein
MLVTTTLFHFNFRQEGVSLFSATRNCLRMYFEVSERTRDGRESRDNNDNKFLTTGIDNNGQMSPNKGVDTSSLSDFKIQLQEFSDLLKRTETILNNFDYNVGHLLIPQYELHFMLNVGLFIRFASLEIESKSRREIWRMIMN